jgi:hypothetical protein
MTLPPDLSKRTIRAKASKRERAVNVLFGLPAWAYIAVAVAGLVAALVISLAL